MNEVDRFHKYMKAEHEKKKEKKKIREYRNGTYVAIMCCSVIPSWAIFAFFVFRYIPMIAAFLIVYVNTTGVLLIAYTIYFYRRLKQ